MSDSLFLCARPSFVEGVSRIFDFGFTLDEFNKSLSPEQADYLALHRLGNNRIGFCPSQQYVSCFVQLRIANV